MKTSTRTSGCGSGFARGASAFTLAELAVTILIVGVTLVGLLQALNSAKLKAAHSRNRKVAAQLALYTLGQVESGLYQEEDVDEFLEGNYAEEGYEDYSFEVIFGEDSFQSPDELPADGFHDAFAYRDRLAEEADEDEAEGEREDEDLPFEKVKVRVTFPKLRDYRNELVLERWVPWEQVYGPKEEEDR